MSDSKNKKRLLKGIHFQFDGAHVALTDASQGGACSMLNDPILLKALKGTKLTKHQESLLEKLGKDISEIDKSMEEVDSSSSSIDEGSSEEENVNKTKENQTNMSDSKLQEQIDALQKELSITKAAGAISKYNFEDEQSQALSQTLGLLEQAQVEVITKAFDALISQGDAKLEKALENKEDAPADEENALAKALSEEAGSSEEGEDSEELTLVEKAMQYTNAKNKEAK